MFIIDTIMSRYLSNHFQVHPSFTTLIPKYDGFILDQYGVMHNGQNGLDGAAECVHHLSSLGKKLMILSNTSAPSQMAVQKLPQLGFDPQNFLGAVTSGEEASRYIRAKYGNGKKKVKALWFTWDSNNIPSPQEFLNQCGGSSCFELLDACDANKADIIIAHGSSVIQGSSAETSLDGFLTTGNMKTVIQPILETCIPFSIPMYCANPDLIVMKPDGSKGHMPGKIGQLYEQLGGQCTYFGKPHVPHFEACLRDLGLDRSRVAHVGDSLHHDIAGANAAGIDSIFVTGGIHGEELGADLGVLPDMDRLNELFDQEGHTPTHVVPMFRL